MAETLNQADLISPFDEPPLKTSPSSIEDKLVSPFDIRTEAEKLKDERPDIGPVEEIEGMLTIASSLVATPVAGLAGLSQIISNKLSIGERIPPEKQMEWVTRHLTYQPRTEGGQAYAETLSTPFELMEGAGQYVGDKVFEVTESPALATDAKVATLFAIPFAIPPLAKRTVLKPAQWGAKQIVSGASFVAESVNMIRPKARAKFSKEAVGRSLRENIGDSPEVMANIAESARLAEEMPGYKPTLAETTLKPGTAVRERTLAEANQASFDLAKSRREANIRAIEDFRRENFGDSSPEITKILQKSEGNINKALTALDDRLTDIQYRREVLASKSPSMELDAVGRELRRLEKAEYDAASAVGEMLYKRIGNEKVDPSPVVSELEAMSKNELLDFSQDQIPASFKLIQRTLSPPKPADLPPARTMREFQVQKAELEAPPKEISFDTLRSIEKRLKRDLAKEQGKMGKDETTIHLITRVLDRVEEVKTNLESTGGADTVAALKEANAYWKEGVVDRFYKGAARDIHAKTAFNEFRIVDEKVIDSFFSPATKKTGGVKAVDDFINTYGMNPEAWVQLRLGVYAKFRKESGIDQHGVIDTKKAEAFLNKHRDVLNRIPAIRDEISGLSKTSKELDFAQQLVKKREANISRSVLARALKSSNADTIVGKSIKEHKIDMALLKQRASKVKGGVEALSKETGRQLLLKAERTDGSINSSKLLHEMTKNEASLKIGMTPYHYGLLRDLHRAYLRIDKNILPQAIKEPKLGLEIVGEKFGTTPAQAISAWRAKSRGLVGGPHLVAQLGTSFITKLNKNQINSLERLAHYDKDVAQTLLMMTKSEKISPKVERRLRVHLAEYGLVNLSAREGIEEK